MKTKNLRRLLFATTLCGLLFTACKKSNSSSNSGTSTDEVKTQADDEARVSNETDAAFNDVSTAMTNQASITGSSQSRDLRSGIVMDGHQDTLKGSLICNAVVSIDTIDNPHTITITYTGKTPDSLRSRAGTIVISWQAGAHWTTAGTQVTVQFQNLKITRLLDNKSIIFNGTHTYTNVSGGSLTSLTSNSASPITHTITSDNMTITFDDGSQRSWSFARVRVFSYNNGLVIAESGNHTSGSMQNISEWGTNRYGNPFTAQIPTPLTVTQSCGWQVTSGVYILTNNAGTLTLTFGLDSAGQPTTGCALLYYFTLNWAASGGKDYTFTLPY